MQLVNQIIIAAASSGLGSVCIYWALKFLRSEARRQARKVEDKRIFHDAKLAIFIAIMGPDLKVDPVWWKVERALDESSVLASSYVKSLKGSDYVKGGENERA